MKSLFDAKRPIVEDMAARISELPGVAKIILYGSYAKGTQSPESDIDIAVFYDVDKTFFLEEYRMLAKIALLYTEDVQIQAFGLYELYDPSGIIEEIVTYGIELPIEKSPRRSRIWRESSSTVLKLATPRPV